MSIKDLPLREGIDYVLNSQGLMVLTREYHLKRGYCCQSGCQNCPWDYASKTSPDIPAEWGDPELEFQEVNEDDSEDD